MNNSFETIITEYGTWLDTLGYSQNMIYCYKFCLRDFFEWLENRQIHSITELTDKHISNYHAYLETRPNKVFKGRLLSVSSLIRNFSSIDKLLEFLHQYGMTNAPVPVNRRIKTDKVEQILKIEVFTQEEIKILYNCISKTYPNMSFKLRQEKHYELKLIFALCYGCGLRKTEAYNLRIQDVDFEKKAIFVKQGKYYKDRVVPMSTGVYNDLRDYIYNFRHKLKLDHNRLFILCKAMLGEKLKNLQNACNDENIKGKRLTLHILRHSIATHLLQNGMSVENIALFLGHSTLDTTQLYTHLIN